RFRLAAPRRRARDLFRCTRRPISRHFPAPLARRRFVPFHPGRSNWNETPHSNAIATELTAAQGATPRHPRPFALHHFRPHGTNQLERLAGLRKQPVTSPEFRPARSLATSATRLRHDRPLTGFGSPALEQAATSDGDAFAFGSSGARFDREEIL